MVNVTTLNHPLNLKPTRHFPGQRHPLCRIVIDIHGDAHVEGHPVLCLSVCPSVCCLWLPYASTYSLLRMHPFSPAVLWNYVAQGGRECIEQKQESYIIFATWSCCCCCCWSSPNPLLVLGSFAIWSVSEGNELQISTPRAVPVWL